MTKITDALASLKGCLDEAFCKRCPTVLLAGTQPLALGNDMAWVRLVNAYPSKRFPSQDTESTSCKSPLAYALEIGVIHCLPIPNRSPMPTAEAMTAMAVTLSEEMMDLRSIPGCCLGEDWDVLLGNWVPIGPQGALIGGAWQFAITRTYGDD